MAEPMQLTEDYSDPLIKNLPLVCPFLTLESLWKLRSVSKKLKESVTNRQLWWTIIKQHHFDPPLNPYREEIDWVLVSLALGLDSQQLDKAIAAAEPNDLMSAGLKLKDIHRLDLALTLVAKAVEKLKVEETETSMEKLKAYTDALHNLGLVRGMNGDITQADIGAEGIRRKVLAQYEKCAPDSLDVAKAAYALADALYVQKKDDEALPLYTRAMELRKKLCKEDSEEIASSLVGLGMITYRKDPAAKKDEALAMLRQALEIRTKLFGDTHESTARVLHNIGTILLDTDPAKAISEYEHALKIRQTVLGPAHPHTRRVKRLVDKSTELATGKK